MRNRIVIINLFVAVSVVSCFFPRIALSTGNYSTQQASRKKQAKRAPVTDPRKGKGTPSRDYSKFSHRSEKHRNLTCLACHKSPTVNWPAASGFPDVADYPSHDACTRCHRAQFFKGARPVICTVCHTKVSPRDRERFAFKKPNQPSQFGKIFPHDKHQDVIAFNGLRRDLDSAHFIRRATFAPDEKSANYNNCTICHKTEFGMLAPPGGFPDNIKPEPGTYKTAPNDHASCFNCHWKNQEPTHENCEACHRTLQTDAAILEVPQRKSVKFKHVRGEGKQHEAECTVCHINITRETRVAELKPDVPISSCGGPSCHGKSTVKTKVTIATETRDRKKNRSFTCTKCHTSDVGARDEPASHIPESKG